MALRRLRNRIRRAWACLTKGDLEFVAACAENDRRGDKIAELEAKAATLEAANKRLNALLTQYRKDMHGLAVMHGSEYALRRFKELQD